jgi:HEAT repeat protein
MSNIGEIGKVKDLIQSLWKTKKIFRMYPENNPMYVKALDDSFSKFREYFLTGKELTLAIGHNEICCNSEQVYFSNEKDDNLAFLFYKDGLREITFTEGLTYEEMVSFLKIICLDFRSEALDDDIVTLFWENDFQSIRYVVDELVLDEDEEDFEAKALMKLQEKEDDDHLLKVYQDAFSEEDVRDLAIVPLSDMDLQQILSELEKESLDKIYKLWDILSEMLYLAEGKEEYNAIGDYFCSCIQYLVGCGKFTAAIGILSQLKQLEEGAAGEEAKEQARRAVSFTSSEHVIGLLGEVLDANADFDGKILHDFVHCLDRNAIPPLMKILGDLQNRKGRELVIDTLVHLGRQDITTLVQGLNDTRRYVVRNVVCILRRIGDKKALEDLLKIVKHGDFKVKLEIIMTFGEFGGGGGVLLALRNYLDDPESQVRSESLKALGAIGTEGAKRIVMSKIRDEEFGNRPFEEKKLFFKTLCRWNDLEVYKYLVATLKKKKTLFGRSKNYESRACAAYGLGLMGKRDALTILRSYKNDGNALLRDFVHTAVIRLEHGQ